jgi:hypothetical protein
VEVFGFWSSAVENNVLLGYVAAPWLFWILMSKDKGQQSQDMLTLD